MTFVDNIIDAVENSDQLNGDTRGLVSAFLEQNRPLLERLGQEAAQRFIDALRSGGADQAMQTLTDNLDESDLLELLKQVGPPLDAAIDWRAAATAQWRSFAESIGEAALGLVVQAVAAAL